MFGKSKRKTWRCTSLDTLTRVSARQELIPEWDQEVYASATIMMVGAGGLGGEVAEGLTRKGAGRLHICDPDIVTPSNLNRQKFVKKSLYKPKASELCRVLSRQGFMGTVLHAHDCAIQDVDIEAIRPDAVLVGVDNRMPDTREHVSRVCYHLGIPVVIMAVSTDADIAYVFVQEPGEADWVCQFKPELSNGAAEEGATRCPNVPAVCDILKAITGHALYAVDSLILNRPRKWNYRVISLSSEFGGSHYVQRRPGCPLCDAKYDATGAEAEGRR